MRAYLAALDSEHAPANPERKPKALSPADPAAAWTTRGRHKVMFGYSLNYLIDLATAIIVDVEATPTRISKEVDATETMIERTVARFALAPDTLASDVAYGTGAMLGWLVGRGIDPHIPVWDQSEVSANGKFPRADFAYDHERDLYICPGGKELKTSGTVHDGTTIKYIAKRSDCAVCPLKRHCTTGLERRISRDVHQDARDYAQALMQTEAYRVSRAARKKIETLFGDAKHNLALVRLRLRGLSGARDEFLLTATLQNLKRLAGHATRRPPQPSARRSSRRRCRGEIERPRIALDTCGSTELTCSTMSERLEATTISIAATDRVIDRLPAFNALAALGLNYAHLGRLFGVSTEMVSCWALGKKPLNRVRRFALEYLAARLSKLIGEKYPMNNAYARRAEIVMETARRWSELSVQELREEEATDGVYTDDEIARAAALIERIMARLEAQ